MNSRTNVVYICIFFYCFYSFSKTVVDTAILVNLQMTTKTLVSPRRNCTEKILNCKCLVKGAPKSYFTDHSCVHYSV